MVPDRIIMDDGANLAPFYVNACSTSHIDTIGCWQLAQIEKQTEQQGQREVWVWIDNSELRWCHSEGGEEQNINELLLEELEGRGGIDGFRTKPYLPRSTD